METKQWYQSKTIIASIAAIVLVVLQMFQGDANVADTIDAMGKAVENHQELLTQLGVMLAGGFAIKGRLDAKETIKRKDSSDEKK